jgi:photosystem II stability/assembly factor-like uncharacterized protein
MILLALAVCASEGSGGRNPARTGASVNIVPGVVLLKVRPGVQVSMGTLAKGAAGLTGRLADLKVARIDLAFPGVARSDLSRIYRLSVSLTEDPLALARQLARDPSVEYAEPKYLHVQRDTPNDPGLTNQSSAFTMMNAFNGWSIAKGSKTVVIADVDGGTYWQHEDLSPNLWINSAEDLNKNGRYDPGLPPGGDEDGVDQDDNGFVDDVIGWNFNLSSGNPNAPPSQPGNFYHGTATASHFGAATNNGVGMAGSSWNCSLMPICAAARSGDNLIEFGYEGIVYAFRNGASVINCSWGRTGGFSRFEQDIINAASAAGALVVTAAGNDDSDNDYTPNYPANYQNLLAVGATQSTSDTKAQFSNYGVSIPVFAPGENIWSAFPNGGYGNGGSGTSYSSPLVAGLAGIVKSLHPAWTPQQIAAQIRVTADSIDLLQNNALYSGKLGKGRVNFARALSESRPAIDIVGSTLLTPSGSELFLTGDTIRLSVTAKNVLFSSAQNIRFSCAPETPDLVVLQGSATVATLSAGQQAQIPAFLFRVRSLTTSKTVVLKLEWSADGNYRDAAAFRTVVFPTYPEWLKQNNPASASLFSVKSVSHDVGWAAGGNEAGTAPVVVRTTNSGQTWTDVTGNMPGRDLYCVDAVDSQRAWVGTQVGEIYATINGGTTWTHQTYPSPQSPFIDAIHFFDPLNGLALGDPPVGSGTFVVLKTTNGGSTWSHLPSEPSGPAGEAGWNNSFSWTDPLHGWFGTNISRIWRTTDGGSSWTFAPTPSSSSIGVSFGTPTQGIAIHTDGVIARSDNGGQSWTRATSPAADPLVSVSHAPGTKSAWTATAAQMYSTSDNGQTWWVQSAYPFAGGVTNLSFSDTLNGWAVTRDGEILRFSKSPVIIRPVPDTYLLEQNYPNPFNGKTLIKFTIPRESRVMLEVYSVLGQKVTTLFDGDCLPETYSATLDSKGLASGVYFYRLRADDIEKGSTQLIVKKLVILR